MHILLKKTIFIKDIGLHDLEKICVVSCSLEIVNLTMVPFAKFHCNSTFSLFT